MKTWNYDPVMECRASVTDADWERMKAFVTDAEREQAAVIILLACAKLMIVDDPQIRNEAREIHEQVLRWKWDRAAYASWRGTYTGEVL
ncbi:MAG: hypothetical protein K2X72_23010 [Reyranella sp.]|nr:hypothetical protein [Reyranella sp.]